MKFLVRACGSEDLRLYIQGFFAEDLTLEEYVKCLQTCLGLDLDKKGKAASNIVLSFGFGLKVRTLILILFI